MCSYAGRHGHPAARHINPQTGAICLDHFAAEVLENMRGSGLGRRAIDRFGNFVVSTPETAQPPDQKQAGRDAIGTARENFLPEWEQEFIDLQHRLDPSPPSTLTSPSPSLSLSFSLPLSLSLDLSLALSFKFSLSLFLSRLSFSALLLTRALSLLYLILIRIEDLHAHTRSLPFSAFDNSSPHTCTYVHYVT